MFYTIAYADTIQLIRGKNMSRKYRLTAALLVICLCVTIIPGRAYAQETTKASSVSAKEQETKEVSLEDAKNQKKEEALPDGQGDGAKSVEGASSDAQVKDTGSKEDPTDAGAPAEDDDPGQGRLTGDVPEEFYDDDGGIQAMAAGIQHNSKFAGYEITEGIDVSKWNKNIDWTAVKNAGIDFAFVRTSYRGYEKGGLATDSYAPANMKNAAAAGVKVGAYIFSQAITVKEAQEEADYLIKSVQGYRINMPLVFDFEYYTGGRLEKAKLSKRAKTDICLAFCERIKEAGYTPLVYANKTMLNKDLYASEISSKYPVWLAHYTNSTDYAGDYSFWQYTSSGKVAGISGNVDMNYWYSKPGDSASFGVPGVSAAIKAPSATTLSGKAAAYDQVKLTWKKVSGASGYRIYRYDTVSRSYKKIKTISGGSTVSYTDTGRSMGTTYKYRVKTYKKSGGSTAFSKASNTVSVKTDSTMTGKTNGTSVTVRKGPSTAQGKLQTLGINVGVTITGTSGNWYQVSLPVGGKAKTGYISKSYVTIIRKPVLTLASAASGKIKLTWSKISEASGYEIQRYDAAKKKYVKIKTIKDGAKVSYTNSGLTKNTTYKYKIRSYKTVRGKKIYSYYCNAKSAKAK